MKHLKRFESYDKFGLAPSLDDLINEIQKNDENITLETVNGKYFISGWSNTDGSFHFSPDNFDFPKETIEVKIEESKLKFKLYDDWDLIHEDEKRFEWYYIEDFIKICESFVNKCKYLNYNMILENKIGKDLYKKLLKGYKIKDLKFILDPSDYDKPDRYDSLIIREESIDYCIFLDEKMMDLLAETLDFFKNDKSAKNYKDIIDYLYYDSGQLFIPRELEI